MSGHDDSGKLIAVIGDEDTVTGFVLAGVGHRNVEGSNYLVVKEDTPIPVIEDTFKTLTNRNDVGILLINQHVANSIRHLLNDYVKPFPTILEIPSKDQPYDPEKDYIMVRVNQMLGFSA
jgi:V-type H+-transporting ATPase subunit F